jgi:hypothetical protein
MVGRIGYAQRLDIENDRLLGLLDDGILRTNIVSDDCVSGRENRLNGLKMPQQRS